MNITTIISTLLVYVCNSELKIIFCIKLKRIALHILVKATLYHLVAHIVGIRTYYESECVFVCAQVPYHYAMH